MGAFRVSVMLHDDELIEFVRQALLGHLTPEAHYIAQRICDEFPELRRLAEVGL